MCFEFLSKISDRIKSIIKYWGAYWASILIVFVSVVITNWIIEILFTDATGEVSLIGKAAEDVFLLTAGLWIILPQMKSMK